VSREPNSEFTVLVLAPTGRNAEAATALLSRDGIAARPCASIPQLCELLQAPVGAVLIEEEAIASPREQSINFASIKMHWRSQPMVRRFSSQSNF
jgi:hypothetical protein